MIHKKYTGILLVICLLFSLFVFSSCGQQETQQTPEEEPSATQEDINARVESKLDAYKTDLLDSAESMESNADIREYLLHWAKTKSIEAEADAHGNVIMKVKCSKGYEAADPTVILCPYDVQQYKTLATPIALSLYIVKNYEKTGVLNVVFSPQKQNRFTGVKKLSSDLFSDDTNVFLLTAAEKGMASLSSGTSSTYTFTSPKFTRVQPELTIAYEISISGLPEGRPDTNLENHRNPILMLNSVLASLKNKNIAYEIADFNGGTGTSLYPTSATLTITVDADKEGAFIEHMDKTIETFLEKYGDQAPGATLEYSRTAFPKTVLPADDTRQIVGFLYTLLHGIYSTDENNKPMSFVDVSGITTTEHRVMISSCACSKDEMDLKEIDTGEETLCSLSNFKYKKTSSIPGWNGAESQDPAFSDAFAKAYSDSLARPLNYLDSVAATPAAYVVEKNPNLSMICITLNDNILPRCTSAIVRYLLDTTGIEEETTEQN